MMRIKWKKNPSSVIGQPMTGCLRDDLRIPHFVHISLFLLYYLPCIHYFTKHFLILFSDHLLVWSRSMARIRLLRLLTI